MTVRSFRIVAVMLFLLAALPAVVRAEEPIRVVATVSPLADIIRKIGGRYVSVSTVLPPGTYPFEYQFQESHLARVRGTDLVIRIGEGGDPWSNRLIAAAGATTKVINAARPEDLDIAARTAAGGGAAPVPMLYVWLDPRIVRERILPAVERALIGLAPGHAEEFRRNSRFFYYELSKLEFEAGALLAQMPKRPFMAQSGAWNFLFNRYSLTPAAIIQADERTEVPPERIARVVAKGKTEGVGLIFRDLRPPTRALSQIAGRLNAKVAPLGIMGNEHPSLANGYLKLMHHNLNKLLTELR